MVKRKRKQEYDDFSLNNNFIEYYKVKKNRFAFKYNRK